MMDPYKTTPLALDSNLNCDGVFLPFKSEWPIMQFTGLKDEKGVEIFEGDIVVFHAKTCGSLYRGYCQAPFLKGQIFIVKRLDSGWALTDPKIKDSTTPNQIGHVHNYEFWNHARSLEVIGNIFENPELYEQ